MFRLAGFGRRHLPLHRVVATGGAKHGGLLGSEYPTTGLFNFFTGLVVLICGVHLVFVLWLIINQEDVCNLRLEAACMPTMPEGILKVKCLASVVGGFWTKHCMSSGVSPRNFSTAVNSSTELDPISDKDRGTACVMEDFTLEIGDSESFLQNYDKSSLKVEEMLDRSSLKEEYARDVRPILASKLLLVNRPLDGEWLAYVNALTHSVLKCSPLYLTSLDVMLEKRKLGEKEWNQFLGHILSNRIAVADDDWLHAFGCTEKHHFHHGIKGPCEDGSFFRGGSDSTYDEHAQIATISADLMKDAKLSWCAVYRDIPCPNILFAEAFGMYLLLKHCLKLNLKRGSVWTDNKLLYELLLGSRSVNANDSTYRIIQLLRILIAKFEVLIPCWVPRELLFVADGIARVIKDFEANLLEGQHINDEAVKIEAKRSVMQFLAKNSLPGKKKKLVVVAGSDVPEDCYADSRACSIILSLPHEVQKLEMRGINEVNVETFAFFNGAVFDPTRLYDKKSRKK
uniref:Uncharacterized protein n=1 Tax=Oryza meridionalis TaxID=40149 RepID=A0A0E0DY74_9ORYZ